MSDPTGPPCDADRLSPCPFCGGDAEIVEAAEAGPQAYVVQCSNPTCQASSAVIFALMDDVKWLLMERWNRRAVNEAGSRE